MSAIPEHPRRHAISADEFLRMGQAGVFSPTACLELIDGEIIDMPPIGSPHASTVTSLTQLLVLGSGESAVVWVQNPLIIDERSVPQPDLALLEPRADNYFSSHPLAADALLVIEVSDTTLSFDLETKVPLYARSGIAETWVVDLAARIVHVFRDADAGAYRTTFAVNSRDTLRPVRLSAIEVPLSAVFP